MFKSGGSSKDKADKGGREGIKPVGVNVGLPTLLDTDGPIAKEVMSLSLVRDAFWLDLS